MPRVTPATVEANATIQVRVNGGSFSPVASGTASGPLAILSNPDPRAHPAEKARIASATVARHALHFNNTNPLVRNASWDIGLSKTGYISEAGRCLVMQAKILQRPVVIVLLDSWGKRTRVGDAVRIKNWMENAVSKSVRRASHRG